MGMQESFLDNDDVGISLDEVETLLKKQGTCLLTIVVVTEWKA